MYEYNAKVVNVVDGDTLDLEIDLGFSVKIKERVRLLGVDTPELRIKEERDKALEAKEAVIEDLFEKEVKIISKKSSLSKDRYGRYLVTVMLGDEIYNNTLIERGLVKDNSKWNTGV